MQAFKNRSLTALYPASRRATDIFFNVLYYNCLQYVEFYLCAFCVLADLCLCQWCFLCLALRKDKFPYAGAKTLIFWKRIGLYRDLGRRLGWISMPDCKFLLVCGNLYTYCRPCSAGYFPVAPYIKLSHMVCEPPIVACDISVELWGGL